MEYNFAECGLGRLLSDIYHNYLLDMRPDVRFDLMLPDEDMKITTDAVRLRQVLDHLLSNAAKFTFAGHIGLGYAIAADVRTVELFVEDTGCGIPEDKQRDISKRFFKVDSFVQGAGLGLPICRTITERLGENGVVRIPVRGGFPLCGDAAAGRRIVISDRRSGFVDRYLPTSKQFNNEDFVIK